MIYTLDNVSFSYGSHNVLHQLSMEIEAGKLHAIIGANGAGKSTLIRLLAGLESPQQGTVAFLDRPMQRWKTKEKAKHVAYMAQNPPVPPDFRVQEIVEMARFASKKETSVQDNARIVMDAMGRAGVVEFAERYVGELSGGERQRVLLAAAFAQNTPVLLLDEVTSALDMNHSLLMMEEIRAWVAGEKTAIMILHDINMAARFADVVWVMGEQGLIAKGSPKEVLTEAIVQQAFGVSALVDQHTLTGTPLIVPFMRKHDTVDMKPWYVVGGGGSALPILSVLYQQGLKARVGIVNAGDTDHRGATYFDFIVDEIPAFESISQPVKEEALSALADCQGLIFPQFPIGLGNAENIALIEWAKDKMPVYYCPWATEPHYVAETLQERWTQACAGVMTLPNKKALEDQLHLH